jgi:hypothetical protein
MKFLNKKGTVLLFAVVAITAISVLGTGIYFMTTTATFSGLGANAQNRAYQLAVAGRDYALAKNLVNTTGREFTFANGDKFNLVISGDKITSTGIVNKGTPYEAKRTIIVTKTGFSSQADISLAKDLAAFAAGIRESTPGFVNATATPISLGQFQARQFGSVWYSGNATQGNCQNGKCDFGGGFRAYFVFKLERDSYSDIPHGFTFAFFNGTNNTNTSAGGDLRMPELLAYAGNSCKRDSSGYCNGYIDPNPDKSKKGIQPPKIAIEFDARRNYGSNEWCNPTNIRNSNSRSDGVRNHMAYVFWGDNTTCSIDGSPSPTYDDNRHGNGNNGDAEPQNAIAPVPETTYKGDYFVGATQSWVDNWLYSYSVANVYAVRIEVARGSNALYTINTWIKRCNSTNISDPSACATDEHSNVINPDFNNTKVAYNPQPTDLPALNRAITLSNTTDKPYHSNFDKFLFGWTAATGSDLADNIRSREKLYLNQFRLNFIK